MLHENCFFDPPTRRLATALAVHPKGLWIAVATMSDNFEGELCGFDLSLVNPETGEIRELPISQQVRFLSWRPHSNELVAVDGQQMTHWDVTTSTVIRAYPREPGIVHALRWNREGSQYLTSNSQYRFMMRDIEGQILNSMQFEKPPHPNPIWGVSSADWLFRKKMMITTDGDRRGSFTVWKPSGDTFREVHHVELNRQGPTIGKLSNQGDLLAVTTADDGRFQIYRTDDWTLMPQTWNALPFSFQWSPNDKIIATKTTHPGINLWDVATGKLLKTIHAQSEVHSVIWNPRLGLVYSGELYYPEPDPYAFEQYVPQVGVPMWITKPH